MPCVINTKFTGVVELPVAQLEALTAEQTTALVERELTHLVVTKAARLAWAHQREVLWLFTSAGELESLPYRDADTHQMCAQLRFTRAVEFFPV